MPFAAQLQIIDKRGRFLVKNDEGKELWILESNILKTLNDSFLDVVDDMINLGDLQEYSILRNLHLRYKKKLIYVSIS